MAFNLSFQLEYDVIQFLRTGRLDEDRIEFHPFQWGLGREGTDIPFQQALQSDISAMVLNWLSLAGIVDQKAYLVKGRRKSLRFIDPPIWTATQGTLHFSSSSLDMVLALFNNERKLPAPKTLGDSILFHLLMERFPERKGGGALHRLLTLRNVSETSVKSLLRNVGPDFFRALDSHLADIWKEELRKRISIEEMEPRMAALREFATGITAYFNAVEEMGRLDLSLSIFQAYRKYFLTGVTPEDVLMWAAQEAAYFRQVFQREEWLHLLGAVFYPGRKMYDHAERIKGLPNLDRDEAEKVFFDAVQGVDPEFTNGLKSLHEAFIGTVV